MRPFNLEEYLANPSRKVVTRLEKNARIICTDRKSEYPIVALVDDEKGIEYDIFSFTKNGRFISGVEDPSDLFFVTEKKEGWINIYKDTKGNICTGINIFPSKEVATEKSRNYQYITTVKIEWEE